MGGDLDADPDPAMIVTLARLTRLDAEAIAMMALPQTADLVRPRRRTAFCPACWSEAIDAGGPRFFGRHGSRVWQFLCPVHGLPLLSGPRGLWLLLPSGNVRKILQAMVQELRSFLDASGRIDATALQTRTLALIKGVNQFIDDAGPRQVEEVAETLIRIANVSMRPFDHGWFRRLGMPATSPPPEPPLFSLLDATVEQRRAHFYAAAAAIMSGRLPPLTDTPYLPNCVLKPDQVKADRKAYMKGASHYDPPPENHVKLEELLDAYPRVPPSWLSRQSGQ
jgi:hypothetical protein